ncbi:MAG: DUF1934 domain-containing protein [Lachnospiraceae bacterium]|nr:DUF1934 domain-containing protein [Lachnospiraceae bacterium]
MTKEVIAAIRGLHFSLEDGTDQIETITPAEYFYRSGCHYLIYEDVDEGSGQRTKNLLKWKPHLAELTRKGMIDVHMVFEEQKKNVSRYTTPFGSVTVGIDTSKVDMNEEAKKITLSVDYALDINYEQFATCKIGVEISARDAGIHLVNCQ